MGKKTKNFQSNQRIVGSNQICAPGGKEVKVKSVLFVQGGPMENGKITSPAGCVVTGKGGGPE